MERLTFRCEGCGERKGQACFSNSDIMKKKRRLIPKRGRHPKCLRCREKWKVEWSRHTEEEDYDGYCQLLARKKHLKPWLHPGPTKGCIFKGGDKHTWDEIRDRTEKWRDSWGERNRRLGGRMDEREGFN